MVPAQHCPRTWGGAWCRIGRPHALNVVVAGTCGIPGVRGNGYIEVVGAHAGVLGSVCSEGVEPLLQLVLDDLVGAGSPVILERTPISSTLACAVEDQALARSRVAGFDYDGLRRAVAFFGVAGVVGSADVACSYRHWSAP